jgi:hypothetical protein
MGKRFNRKVFYNLQDQGLVPPDQLPAGFACGGQCPPYAVFMVDR